MKETKDKIPAINTNDNSKNDDKDIPENIDELLEDVPEPKRKSIERTMVAGFSMMQQNSPESEIAKKMTTEHIGKFLDMSNADMEHHYKEKRDRKIFTMILMVIAAAFFIIVIAMLKSQPDLLERVIPSAISLIVGVIGGYGYGKSKKDE